MKNIAFGLVLFGLFSACSSNTQTNKNDNVGKEYSYFWGISESDNYSQMSKKKDSLKTLRDSVRKDTTAYEIKSYLWGAVKIAKKKSNNEKKKEQNE